MEEEHKCGISCFFEYEPCVIESSEQYAVYKSAASKVVCDSGQPLFREMGRGGGAWDPTRKTDGECGEASACCLQGCFH